MAPLQKISTTSKYAILKEVVKDYPGILSATETLFRELTRYPCDWDCTVREMRTYALKNFYIHDRHENGAEVISTIIDVFLEAILSADVPVRQSAVDTLLFYLERILVDSNNALSRYSSIFKVCFQSLKKLQDDQFFILVTNPHQLKKLGQIILAKMPEEFDFRSFNELLIRFFLMSYKYWLKEEDPVQWVKNLKAPVLTEEEAGELEELFQTVSHDNLNGLIAHLNNIKGYSDRIGQLKELLQLPGYMQIVRFYEDIIAAIAKSKGLQKNADIKIAYLLRIMDIRGLSGIHENTLREINRTVSQVIKTGEEEHIKSSLMNVFLIFKKALFEFSETSLYCIQSIGNDIYRTENSKLVQWYNQQIISSGFQYPEIKGVTDEWQVKTNLAHLKNIRVWLELIENNPKWSKSLISALIINLNLGGVHISDTDLFQKDITKLLNSDIKPVYHSIKELARLFPVYFSEIGAEGALREVSTDLDESTGRADILVHFLRKQSHVESSARVVDFIEEVLNFWRTKDKNHLKDFLHEDVYERIKTGGSYIDDMSTIFNFIFTYKAINSVTDLLSLAEEEAGSIIKNIPDVSEREKKRAYLAIRFYQLLNKKYKLDPQDIQFHLQQAQCLGLPNVDLLISILDKGSLHQRLEAILNYMQLLKDIILAPESYEPVEQIFRKRHIAAGIASMYGMYHERKFDALALTFRLENLANIFFEELIHSINLKFITRATLFQIQKYTTLFFRALQLDGISSTRLEHTIELLAVALDVRRFSFSQYIDIFRGFSEAVQDILNNYYSGIFKGILKQIILQIGTGNILHKYLEPGRSPSEFEFINKVSEQFLRESVSGSFGLQQLDVFVSRILKTLFEQAEGLDIQNLDLLMSYDPKKALSSIYNPNFTTNDRIHLGNKGYNLIKMASLGIPVPPGFVITTEVFRCEKVISRFRYVKEHLEEGIKEQIAGLEKMTGKKFSDPYNPLLVSVRSGGAISMPGMMISFLNVGINESIVEGLIKQTGRPWFAWDCYRRFLQCWGMSFGIERDKFDEIMNSFKGRYNVLKKIQFSPGQMRDLAFAYRETVKNNGIEIIDDPMTQIQTAISQVFLSWFSKKAQAYREILGISENWGTAVIVQKMVYGNLDTDSGTGVLFTRSPQESGDRVMLWGDFATGAQGEDIVLGLVKTLPISKEQKPLEDRTSEVSLEEHFPDLYSEMLRMIKDLIYKERWGAQEIEFTFEGKTRDRLYLLQTRDMTITRQESFLAFVPSKKLSSHYLSRGIGVGGGALSGRVVFDLDEIQVFRKNDPSTPLILIRSDTVPDDIRHISAADGLLTSRGGSTSHASIIANRLGKTCVVGCNNLLVWENEKRCKLNQQMIKAGDFLSIDGRNGSVYSGKHQVEEIKAGI